MKRASREPATPRHFPRIYDLVRRVPAGRVVSYGMVAAMVDRCTPRIVGYAMASVPAGSDVPWHRVINSQGRISLRDGAELQRRLLEAEGVVFDERGRVDLERFAWKGPGTRRRKHADATAEKPVGVDVTAARPVRAPRSTRKPSARDR